MKKALKKTKANPVIYPYCESLFSKYEAPKSFSEAQVFVGFQLQKIMEEKTDAEDCAVQIMGLYEAVRHNPELKIEAAAMKAFYDAQNVLQKFVFANQ
jgi:hypothetical protein